MPADALAVTKPASAPVRRAMTALAFRWRSVISTNWGRISVTARTASGTTIDAPSAVMVPDTLMIGRSPSRRRMSGWRSGRGFTGGSSLDAFNGASARSDAETRGAARGRMLARISRGEPAAWMRPASMKTIREATSRANVISCVTTIMVMPSATSSRTTISTSPMSSGSSAEVISSRSRTLGSIATARAMPTRCCWPPESSIGRLPSLSPSPTRVSQRSAVRRASSRDKPRTFRRPSITFSSAVRCGNRLNSWNTMPMSARIRESSRSLRRRRRPSVPSRKPTSTPSTWIEPAS